MKRWGVVIAVMGAVAVAATLAVAQSSEDEALSSAELEVAAADASGDPGENTPPCPAEDVVDQLKDAGIEFGPCLPIPDDIPDGERKAMLEEAPVVEEPTRAAVEGTLPRGELCSVVSARTVDGEIVAEVPCGSKVTNEEYIQRDGTTCLKLESMDRTNPAAQRRTDVVCAKGDG